MYKVPAITTCLFALTNLYLLLIYVYVRRSASEYQVECWCLGVVLCVVVSFFYIRYARGQTAPKMTQVRLVFACSLVGILCIFVPLLRF